MRRSLDDAPWDKDLKGYAAESSLHPFFEREKSSVQRYRRTSLKEGEDYIAVQRPGVNRKRIYWHARGVEKYARNCLGWNLDDPKVTKNKAIITRVHGSGRWVMTTLGKVYVKRSPFWTCGLEIEVFEEASGMLTCPRAPRRKWKF
tara:strand:+ start:7081 stop:7518 length:438 start_codon:yes stop_codon:yes gene_type:complete